MSLKATSSERLLSNNHNPDFMCNVEKNGQTYEFIFSDIATLYQSTKVDPQNPNGVLPALIIAFETIDSDGITKLIYDFGLRYTLELNDNVNLTLKNITLGNIYALNQPTLITIEMLLKKKIQMFKHQEKFIYPVKLNDESIISFQRNQDIVFKMMKTTDTSFFFDNPPSKISFLILWGEKMDRCISSSQQN